MGDFIKHTFDTPERFLYGNSVADWIAAAIIATATWFALWFLRQLLAARFKRYSSGEGATTLRVIAYLIANTKQFLFLALALYVGKESLTLPLKLQRFGSNLALILILVQVGLWGGRALRYYLELKEKERGADRMFAGSLDIINFLARILIWSLLILVALDNLGVNITALLAGLGVGGVAVALALQKVLGDLFASLSIALDKPFVVGDTLTIDTFTGTVERIGIKTTRLRSDAGEQIVLSNADILKSRVRNYGRASELRTVTILRVAYDTPTEKLLAIPKLLEQIVAEQSFARFERCHLKTFGEWSLQFELAYFRKDPHLYPLLDLQQAVNLRILEEFRRLNIQFALAATRVPGVD
jgi:small-conductance mechanosensitive channel